MDWLDTAGTLLADPIVRGWTSLVVGGFILAILAADKMTYGFKVIYPAIFLFGMEAAFLSNCIEYLWLAIVALLLWLGSLIVRWGERVMAEDKAKFEELDRQYRESQGEQ